MIPGTLAAIATIPSRAHLLPRVLRSLRPQVERLSVYLNGWKEVPTCVREFADDYVDDPVNGGAERKLYWAQSHGGVYFCCDDDIRYPADYVETMCAAVEQFDGRAIVSAHGRIYPQCPRHVHEAKEVGVFSRAVPIGRWINHCGSGVAAWDARKVRVPRHWAQRNIVDCQFAEWAQLNSVPIWLLPHKTRWLGSLAPMDPKGIYRSSRAENHVRRNAILERHGRTHGWKLLKL